LAESPLLTLGRLLGGVVLMQGRLGHQILGQMLVMNTNEVAIVGAAAVIAATSREHNAGVQIALRTAVPFLALRGLLQKQQDRLDHTQEVLAEQQERLDEREDKVRQRERRLAQAQQQSAAAAAASAGAAKTLEATNAELQRELKKLSVRRAPAKRARRRPPVRKKKR
jgi:septal ring factor EnvC (AmiA/AmiB activator)